MPANNVHFDTKMPLNLGNFWTLANLMSLLRAVLAFPVGLLIILDASTEWILGLILAAGMTDWLDGKIARWSKSVSNWGKVLDPLCDKVAILVISLALVLSGRLPLWFALVVVARDLLIVIGSVVLTRKIAEVQMSIRSGKVAVTAMAITILAGLLSADAPIMNVCIWSTVVLMSYSFSLYIARFLSLIRRRKPAHLKPGRHPRSYRELPTSTNRDNTTVRPDHHGPNRPSQA